MTENTTNSKLNMYYRSVKEKNENLKPKNDFNTEEQKNILKMISSIKFSTSYDITALKISDNAKESIENLFNEFYKRDLEILINDFCQEMKTQMKGDDRYVIFIQIKNNIILTHTKMAQKSMSTEFSIYERLLDKDNIMRVVCFQKNKNEIKVKHYEKNKTKFFVNWLGISEHDLNYSFGGINKFYSSIHGITITLELDDKDIDSIEDNEFLEISDDNIITFKKSINQLQLNHIIRTSNNKRYETFNQLNNDLILIKHNIKYYKDKYKEITYDLDNHAENKENKWIDCENEVKGKSNNINKDYNMFILFCTIINERKPLIELDKDFLNKIYTKYSNNEPCEITHIGDEFSPDPLKIGNIKLYNKFHLDLSKSLIDYLYERDLSENFRNYLMYVIFQCLKEDNKDMRILYFIDEFSNKLLKDLKCNLTIDENDLLEFKKRDYVTGNNSKIIDNLVKDIPNKLGNKSNKLYLIGYDERAKNIEPIALNNFHDSRMDYIQGEIKKKLKEEHQINCDLKLVKIPVNEHEFVLFMMITSKKT